MRVVVRQFSGLGNQLFQYAAARYYAQRLNASLSLAIDPPGQAHSYGLPRPFLLSNFAIDDPVHQLTLAERLLFSQKPAIKSLLAPINRARRIQAYTEPLALNHTFQPDLPLTGNPSTLYLSGFFQTHKLPTLIEPQLRTALIFRNAPNEKNRDILQQISQSQNPVSLHVRRGDYLLAKEAMSAIPDSYYANAIAYFRERLQDPTFFIFSDDIPYTRQSLPKDIRAVFVDHNQDPALAHEDLRLMSACHHHIIANSSFSWWGAWLNPCPDKVVFAPKYWRLTPDSYYPDLYSPNWILGEF